MINSIQGEAVQAEQDQIIVDLGPLSLALFVANRDSETILDNPDQEIFTELEVRDNGIDLVGFASSERRALYRALRTVPGIGQKSALVILDCGEVVDILRAVSGRDHDFLSEVPGVGSKRVTAIFDQLEKRYNRALPQKLPIPGRVWVEARQALILQGEDFISAEKIIFAVVGDQINHKWTSEEIYRQGLEYNLEKEE